VNNLNSQQDDIELKKIKFKIRINYIKKVYAIVIIQLLFTLFVNCLSFNETVKNYFDKNYFVLGIAISLLLSVFLFINIKKNISKEVPYNYFLLILFTFSISIILLFLSSAFTTKKIIIIWCSIILMCSSIVLLSFLLKNKFQILIAILIILFIAILFLGIMMFFSKIILEDPDISILFTVITSLGAIFFGVYLIIHTKLLVIDKIELNTDRYIIASMQIYSDVVLIFISLICSVKD
jgi:FtsH-binding integral membrane protein